MLVNLYIVQKGLHGQQSFHADTYTAAAHAMNIKSLAHETSYKNQIIISDWRLDGFTSFTL